MQNQTVYKYAHAPTMQVQSVRGLRTKLVITDVDGTLASFWDYFVPAMREYLDHTRSQLDVPVEMFTKDLGKIIDERGTHEFPWLLECTEFARQQYSGRPQEFFDRYVRPFWESLDENREKYLRPFPMVVETLEALKSQGIKIVALSDAPEYMARVRNKQLFNGVLDAVYALDTPEPAPKHLFDPSGLEYGRGRIKSLRASCVDCISPIKVLPLDYEKPSAMGVDRILEDFGVLPHEVIFIGDSVVKDGMVAASRGMRFIWAHYGITLPAEYDQMIHYSLKPEAKEPAPQPYLLPPAVAVAARYDEVLNHI
ncbi:MAG TPA: HAD family hydrolase [Planktothrix sp.]|jgi:phosphoglycolate phosphatase